jgi:hypothetical protein
MRERSKEMISFGIEIIITGVMFFVGVYASVEMHRAAQRTVLEWRTTGRQATTPRQRRRSLLTLVVSFLTGMFVLSHLPEHFTALIFLPFTAGMVFAFLAFIVQEFISLK